MLRQVCIARDDIVEHGAAQRSGSDPIVSRCPLIFALSKTVPFPLGKGFGRCIIHQGDGPMPDAEKFEILVLGSGEAGKWTAWTMADEGHRTAMIQRKLLGGSGPDIGCLPGKKVIYSARVAARAPRGAGIGAENDQPPNNMASGSTLRRE